MNVSRALMIEEKIDPSKIVLNGEIGRGIPAIVTIENTVPNRKLRVEEIDEVDCYCTQKDWPLNWASDSTCEE